MKTSLGILPLCIPTVMSQYVVILKLVEKDGKYSTKKETKTGECVPLPTQKKTFLATESVQQKR